MRIVELLINEEAEIFGMDKVSLVEYPAIEYRFRSPIFSEGRV